jgi:glucose-1-phosphate thymidylyltransferase
MKVIIPMAGMGKRLRPHTLTIPKPLLPIAGKPIVQRLVEGLAESCDEKIEELAFIVGEFGVETETKLKEIAINIGSKASIYYQKEALGTGHAILCAKNSLQGKLIVAFADTLFNASFKLDASQEGIIWVKQIEDPSAFGVVKLNDEQIITEFVEKPTTFVSDLAIIGIYYFKDGEYLMKELEYVIDNDLKDKGEYQLTTALENMKEKGTRFSAATVSEWLDCGNKDATVMTNQRILDLNNSNGQPSNNLVKKGGTIIEPCFIGNNVTLVGSNIGPFVSIGDNCEIESSNITNSIIQTNSKISSARIDNSMIGNFVQYHGRGIDDKKMDLSIGDYSIIK